jgi:hypothetical protein
MQSPKDKAIFHTILNSLILHEYRIFLINEFL